VHNCYELKPGLKMNHVNLQIRENKHFLAGFLLEEEEPAGGKIRRNKRRKDEKKKKYMV